MAVKNQEEVHLYNITTPVETAAITSVISSAMTHKEQQLCAFITFVQENRHYLIYIDMILPIYSSFGPNHC